jgi:3-oxoadipate enol-lactonase
VDITLCGIRLYAEESGNPAGTPVVFLHGFPFTHAMWEPQAQALKDRRRVLRYDHRGHGKSDVGDGQFPLEFLVDDLIGMLDAWKVEKAVLCGLSMGGYIALRAMERNPERIRGLVLCDTRSEADSNEAKIKRAASIRAVKEQGVAVFAEAFLKSLFPPESFTERPQAVDTVRQIMLKNSPLGVCGALLALATRTDTTASLSAIRVPTLILVGEKDSITPVSAAQALHERIVKSELHIIPNAGHASNVENALVFNQHLRDFLHRLG